MEKHQQEKSCKKEMSDRIYLGIDPGGKGFLTAIINGDYEFYSISDLNALELNKILASLKARGNVVAVMEEVHAIFGSSAKATFNFGEIFGLLKGLLYANAIPFHLVPPKVWQKEIWNHGDMVFSYKQITVKDKPVTRKEINTKATSLNAALRLFPNLDFRKTSRCKKPDDNKIDSILIAEYGRRKNV